MAIHTFPHLEGHNFAVDVTIVSRDVAQQCLLRPAGLDCALSISECGEDPPHGFHEFPGHKLAMFFDDVVSSKHGWVPPELADVQKIVAWAKAVQGTTLIHCAAGISRSTASAVAIPAAHVAHTEANAKSIMAWIGTIREIANPNPLIVQHVDTLLGWNGLLAAARTERFPYNPHFLTDLRRV